MPYRYFTYQPRFDAAWNALCLACVDLKCCIYRVVLDLYMSLYVFHLRQVISSSCFRASWLWWSRLMQCCPNPKLPKITTFYNNAFTMVLSTVPQLFWWAYLVQRCCCKEWSLGIVKLLPLIIHKKMVMTYSLLNVNLCLTTTDKQQWTYINFLSKSFYTNITGYLSILSLIWCKIVSTFVTKINTAQKESSPLNTSE